LENRTFKFEFKKGSRIPSTFQRLKEFCEEYLKSMKGVVYYDDMDKNEMTLEVLKIVYFMTCHGFYREASDLNRLSVQVVSLLKDQTTGSKMARCLA